MVTSHGYIEAAAQEMEKVEMPASGGFTGASLAHLQKAQVYAALAQAQAVKEQTDKLTEVLGKISLKIPLLR